MAASPDSDRLSLRAVALIGAAIVLSALAGPALSLQPRPGERVAVVFPPWMDRLEAVAAIRDAGGDALFFSALGVVAESPEQSFFQRLRQGGALLIVDAARTAALCGAVAPPPVAAPNEED